MPNRIEESSRRVLHLQSRLDRERGRVRELRRFNGDRKRQTLDHVLDQDAGPPVERARINTSGQRGQSSRFGRPGNGIDRILNKPFDVGVAGGVRASHRAVNGTIHGFAQPFDQQLFEIAAAKFSIAVRVELRQAELGCQSKFRGNPQPEDAHVAAYAHLERKRDRDERVGRDKEPLRIDAEAAIDRQSAADADFPAEQTVFDKARQWRSAQSVGRQRGGQIVRHGDRPHAQQFAVSTLGIPTDALDDVSGRFELLAQPVERGHHGVDGVELRRAQLSQRVADVQQVAQWSGVTGKKRQAADVAVESHAVLAGPVALRQNAGVECLQHGRSLARIRRYREQKSIGL